MDSILFISDIFKQKHWFLVKLELVFLNTFKDHVNYSDASLRQYIFLQIGVYSKQKYPLQAWQYETECINVCFVYIQTERKFPYLPVNDHADLNLFIDHALPANKTKTNKMDHDLCVFDWT